MCVFLFLVALKLWIGFQSLLISLNPSDQHIQPFLTSKNTSRCWEFNANKTFMQTMKLNRHVSSAGFISLPSLVPGCELHFTAEWHILDWTIWKWVWIFLWPFWPTAPANKWQRRCIPPRLISSLPFFFPRQLRNPGRPFYSRCTFSFPKSIFCRYRSRLLPGWRPH